MSAAAKTKRPSLADATRTHDAMADLLSRLLNGYLPQTKRHCPDVASADAARHLQAACVVDAVKRIVKAHTRNLPLSTQERALAAAITQFVGGVA